MVKTALKSHVVQLKTQIKSNFLSIKMGKKTKILEGGRKSDCKLSN